MKCGREIDGWRRNCRLICKGGAEFELPDGTKAFNTSKRQAGRVVIGQVGAYCRF